MIKMTKQPDKYKQITEWIMVVAMTVILLASIDYRLIVMVPEFATLGVSRAVFGTYPNAIEAKAFTLIALSLCFCMLYFGIKQRQKIWAKLLVILALVLWILVGFIGMVGAWG